ncbi:MAG: PEGA domain-containing protein, partial [Deltaproteobacteria bacterium]|nr:PEGA domain-containing protein [Deltaproteobacteria bacterium]
LEPVAKELFGTVLVETEPAGAKIFLDTEDTGKVTPATLEKLPVGQSYVLRLERNDFKPLEKKIDITGIQPLSVKEKLAMAAPPEVKPKEIKKPKVEEVKPREIEKPKETGKPKPVRQDGFASIRVTSSPAGADVFVNGEHKGTTPASLKVPAGSVKVMVSKGADMLPCRWSLLLGAGLTENMNCTLGALFGKININSYPPRADVYLNGQKMGGTPMIIKKVQRDKSHTLRVELPGYKPWVKAFDLQDSENKSFNVELEKS